MITRLWRSISQVVPRRAETKYTAQTRLTQAYREVFTGKPNGEDQQLVLADLLKHSGFQRVTSPGVASDVLWQREGMRALYAHIFSFLSLSDADLHALENAARFEAALDEQT